MISRENFNTGKIAFGLVLAFSLNGAMQSKTFAADGCPCFNQADIASACAQGDKNARRLVRDISKGQYALKINCAQNSYLIDRGFTYPSESGSPGKAICQVDTIGWSDGSVTSTRGGPSSELTSDQTQSCTDALDNALSELNLTAY